MVRFGARGWIVTFAGLGINLALGVLYSWSIIAKVLSKPVAEGGWGWTAGAASLPYAIAVGVFAVSMVFAGRAQDRLGPRLVAVGRRRALRHRHDHRELRLARPTTCRSCSASAS